MHPNNERATFIPDGAGVNILTDVKSHYVIQLMGGAEGENIVLKVPSGRWAVEWIDPGTGSKLFNYMVDIKSNTLKLDIPGELSHRIIYLERK